MKPKVNQTPKPQKGYYLDPDLQTVIHVIDVSNYDEQGCFIVTCQFFEKHSRNDVSFTANDIVDLESSSWSSISDLNFQVFDHFPL